MKTKKVLRQIWCNGVCNQARDHDIQYHGTVSKDENLMAKFDSKCSFCGREAEHLVPVRDYNALIREPIYDD